MSLSTAYLIFNVLQRAAAAPWIKEWESFLGLMEKLLEVSKSMEEHLVVVKDDLRRTAFLSSADVITC